ncbi:MAG: chorismate lyase [Burkholderiales bacterium]|jgi:chorismate--pyruvate lyase|nr:chorismate lyase [Burkholderiales bacterium]
MSVPSTDPLHPWLTERHSLTSRLCAICKEFRVVVHQSRFERVCPDERSLLLADKSDRRATALMREVSLVCDGRPLVFGHSILLSRKSGFLARSLKQIGNRSLGSLLFTCPDIRRGSLYFKRIDRQHALYAKSVAALGNEPASSFWARRSVFSLRSEQVCVTEVFSPQLGTIS